MSRPLVLSIFPGIDLLGRAFEELGLCIVRGPDLLWGGDIRRFHPPAGKFEGVIGGPPCQAHSTIARIARHQGFQVKPDMIPEFARCVEQAQPDWWLMENVRHASTLHVAGYQTAEFLLNNRWLGEEQNRLRKWTFGTRDGRRLVVELAALESPRFEPAVLANGMRQTNIALGGSGKPKSRRISRVTGRRRSIEESCRLQGLPDDFLADAPFTKAGKQLVLGNGVPLPMGRAVARAVWRAMYDEEAPDAA